MTTNSSHAMWHRYSYPPTQNERLWWSYGVLLNWQGLHRDHPAATKALQKCGAIAELVNQRMGRDG